MIKFYCIFTARKFFNDLLNVFFSVRIGFFSFSTFTFSTTTTTVCDLLLTSILINYFMIKMIVFLSIKT